VRELEKGGARVVVDDERLRHYELIFVGDVDGSISAARDEFYARPGAKPEMRWSTIMEDLRRRDFSINAVAVSLNPNSRGLLLDPTNGLADLERREVRALSIHAFTNQPIRLMRALRFCARMSFKMEQRTQEWFDLAIERGLHETIEQQAIGQEVIDVAREENPIAILKQFEERDFLAVIHAKLQRRRPDYDGLGRLAKAREEFAAVGLKVRPVAGTLYYMFRKLEPRMASMMKGLEIPAAAIASVQHLPGEARKLLQLLRGNKTKTAREAYELISRTPNELLVFMQAEFRNPRAASKIRNYLQKWRPLRLNLPITELSNLGVPRGPKFDKVIEQLFDAQLRGKGRTPEDVTKLLKQFAGIKDEPKKPPKEEKKKRGKDLHAAREKHMAKQAAESAATEEAAKAAPAEAPAARKPSSAPSHKPAPRAAARKHSKPARKAKKRARR
jgi:tRNA nucleotidyltransferase (CCA-adding enzyme)